MVLPGYVEEADLNGNPPEHISWVKGNTVQCENHPCTLKGGGYLFFKSINK